MDTALYFPHMRLPQSAWLMQVLLYWDQAATIVPEHQLDDVVANDAFMRDLRDVGLLTAVRPDRQGVDQDSFVEGFLEIMDGQRPPASRATVRLHADKMGYRLFRELQDRDLAKAADWMSWVVEKHTGLLYMAYLASVISATNPGMMPVTDTSASIDTLRGRARMSERVGALRYVVITEALPTPTGPVDAQELAAFKERHAEALTRCRRFLDARLVDIARVDDPDEREIRLAAFSQEVSDDVARLVEAMKRRRWPQVTLGGFGGLAATGLELSSTVVGGGSALELGLAVGAAAIGAGTAYAVRHQRRADRFDRRAPMAYAALTTTLER